MHRIFIVITIGCMLCSGCFLESPRPLSPRELSFYDADLPDTWIMPHNLNVTVIIEAYDTNRLKINFPDSKNKQKNKFEYLAHTSNIDGKNYINAIQPGRKLYEIYMFERPCPDLILLYIAHPDRVEQDIKSGVVNGKADESFYNNKYRVVDEPHDVFINYIKQNHQKLFVPFRYLVRETRVNNLSDECKAQMKPLPVDSGKMMGF